MRPRQWVPKISLEPGGPQVLTGKQARVLVRERDGDACWICGTIAHEGRAADDPERATVDHVVERREGGGNFLANLRLAHWICNTRRSNPTRRVNLDGPPETLTPALRRLVELVGAMVEGRR